MNYVKQWWNWSTAPGFHRKLIGLGIPAFVAALVITAAVSGSQEPADEGAVANAIAPSAIVADGVGPDVAPTAASGSGVIEVRVTPATPTPASPTLVPQAKPEDFAIELIVIEKQCFGSAGCNVTVQPDLTYNGPEGAGQGKKWLLVFEVHGGEALETYNLTIDSATGKWEGQQIFTQTASEADVLTAKPVRLLPQ